MVDPAREKELNVSLIVLAKEAQLPDSLSLSYRRLGATGFNSISLPRVAEDRGWYTGKVPLEEATVESQPDPNERQKYSAMYKQQLELYERLLAPSSGFLRWYHQ